MLQLDDLDARDLLANEPTMPAPRVELGLPSEQDALTQPVLERLELSRELRMQQRGNAVRLRVVERPVEQQVGVGAKPLVASLLPRDRVVPGEPHTKALGRGLLELRLKGAEGIARVFFFTLPARRIVMLHTFIKKSRHTPPGELQLALLRMKEVTNKNC